MIALGAESLPLALALTILCYAIGMFPSAEIIARSRGIEVTKEGSGNPGASNITRLMGWKMGVVVFIMDGAKGALAVGIGAIADGRVGAFACGSAAVVGHIFPITRKFKGGKGVATGAGVIFATNFVVSLIVIGTWFLISRITKKSSLASIVAVILVPVCLVIKGQNGWEIFGVAAICTLIIARHADNIRRLIAGSEHSINRDKS